MPEFSETIEAFNRRLLAKQNAAYNSPVWQKKPATLTGIHQVRVANLPAHSFPSDDSG